jgi:glutamyl-tRNA synthetase
MNDLELADLLIPNVELTAADMLGSYPERHLIEGAKVTRIAPSPTGFVHLGVVYAAIISERLAHQSSGVFYLRIEDTDKKREVKGGIQEIIRSLGYFNLCFDEGINEQGKEIGIYGPYKQSERKHIYRLFAKELIKKGMAYPCFCSVEKLDKIRELQKEEKVQTGYYGKWTQCRDLSIDEIRKELADARPYVIRLRSPGVPDGKVACNDLIKGSISLPENIQDIVILKSDSMPTYHFAHVIDDRLMGTTHVFRGDEWLSSVPIHIQLFQIYGWRPPLYGHISPVMKMDGASKRKFSKRKDTEFAVNWYRRQGYSGAAVSEYLLSLINSNFDEWRIKNPEEPYGSFTVSIRKFSGSGALFDINKLNNICRNIVASLSSEKIYDMLLVWAKDNDPDFYDLINIYKEYTVKILGIDKDPKKPRKDIACWSDIKPVFGYFYDGFFNGRTVWESLPENIGIDDAMKIVKTYTDIYDSEDDKTVWFEKIKTVCDKLGYARDMKTFREDPAAYRLHVGDIAMAIRIALTGRTNTPDLYEIMRIMGEKRVIERLKSSVTC